MDTTFHCGEWTVSVSHDRCRNVHPIGDRRIVVAKDCEPNTLSRLDLAGNTQWVHWEGGEAVLRPHVLLTESCLFFGAGTVVLIMGLPELDVVGRENVGMFWGFERRGGYVVRTGEVSCSLYDIRGRRLDEAAVDPPYDMEWCENGIRLRSGVSGTEWLEIPRQTQ